MKNLDKIQKIADKPCECSPLQSIGEDPSVCLPCQVADMINEIVILHR
ncbi:hypothetical protein LCGC14_0823290 [marine sediment metagenome]|uniref:Uncharacterized protein n=1 Tax=marine sediment metagenome TaxID=412755 RepID=A0A0F9PI43_9ZZZZ